MKFEDVLPVGSVVLLKNAVKKVVIIGLMAVKQTEDGKTLIYDYIGVPYPEGYMGPETGLLFYHEDIQEIVFRGYVNDERDKFIAVIGAIADKTEDAVKRYKSASAVSGS